MPAVVLVEPTVAALAKGLETLSIIPPPSETHPVLQWTPERLAADALRAVAMATPDG
jgi:hypothetical protein